MILNQIRSWCDYIDTMPDNQWAAFGVLVLFVVVVLGKVLDLWEKGG